MSAALPKTITAAVAPEAISRASRFYDASDKDILVELFQNARRAGASKITVDVHDTWVEISDNGSGIANPQTLLTFGRSQWAGKTEIDEDSAGMGFFALSDRGAIISSRAKDSTSGWKAIINPEAFQGKTPVNIKTCKRDVGTNIRFDINTSAWNMQSNILSVAEYLPVDVIINNKSKSQMDDKLHVIKDFLSPAVRIVETSFGRIGIIPNQRPHVRSENVNFYGCTLSAGHYERGGFYIRYDITKIDGIQLVLPARKQILQNSLWDEAKALGLKTLYEHIHTLEHHRLKYIHAVEARKLGVPLQDARAILTTWTPDVADYNENYSGDISEVNPTGIIMRPGEEAVGQQLIKNGMDNNPTWKPSLYLPDNDYAGYPWYDGLGVIDQAIFMVTKDGQTAIIDDFENKSATIDGKDDIADDWHNKFICPDLITVTLRGENIDPIILEIGYITIGEGYDPEDLILFMTSQGKSKMDAEDLADFYERAYYCPSDNADSDSWYTQQDDFRTNAINAARKHFMSSDEAHVEEIRAALQAHIVYLCRRDAKVVITMSNFDIDVKVIENPNVEKPE